MAVINLAEAEILRSATRVPLVWSVDRGLSEPTFDYDEEGNPGDFGMDLEPPDPSPEDLLDVDTESLLYNVAPSQFAETAIRVPEAGRVADFLFTGREYLRKIYDTSADKVLLKCGRQVEKCGREVVKVLTPDGRSVRVADMEIGDKIVALELLHPHHQRFGPGLGAGLYRAETTWRFVEDTITDKQPAGLRRVLKVITRMGSEVEVSEDTPLLVPDGWLCAGELEIGQRLAAAKHVGEACRFGEGSGKHPANAPLLGYAIADGGLSGWSITITKKDPVVRQRIMDLLDSAACGYRLSKDHRALIIDKNSLLKKWLEDDGLLGIVSREKFIPGWMFFNASMAEVIEFIKALWVDCDGSVKKNGSRWDIVYATTSRTLAEQVRALLLKLAIPSRIRRNNHPAYKDNPDVDQHLVRVETLEGVNLFLALFTDHPADLDAIGDSNRDTVPKELAQPLIQHICDDYGFGKRAGRGTTSPMKGRGLRVTLKYPLSRRKLYKYLDFFREYGAWKHPAYDKLMELYKSDVIWDEVVSIEDLGEHETFHLEVGKNHNYVQDHVVVHNSTTLGNRLLCYSALTNNFRSLFVAPSAEQAKVFSTDRIKDVVEASPLLKAYTTTKISQAVFFKKFINFSQIRLRYAYLTADRVRGIPADLVCYDKNAEVLTSVGWKPIKDLAIDDVVADVDNSGTVAWHRPSQVFSKKHTGEMVTFSHAGMSLRVTGDHRMWVNYRVKDSSRYKTPDVWQFERASVLARTDSMGFKMTCAADWPAGNKVRVRKFPEWTVEQRVSNQYGPTGRVTTNTYPGLELPYDAFAAVVGWYLAEGNLQRGAGDSPLRRPVLTQNPGAGLDAIVQSLEDCGLDYNIMPTKTGGRRIVINSQILGEYFEPLGTSYDKYIPREFFDHPEVLVHLLKGLWGGDAMYHPGEEWDEGTLKTRSRRLAEDAQEAWLRLGRPAVIHTRMVKPVACNGPNADADVEPLPMYEVCAYKRDYSIFWRSEFESKERIAVERVDGEEVYCFTVEFHRPIVKGGFGQKPVISGQCIDEIQDILVDNIPVIEQCAFHSKYKLFLYSGTPKSMDNTLEHYWTEFSTQNEWAVPCERHGTPKNKASWHWNILGEKSIGKSGLICDKCGALIDATHPEACWVSVNPRVESNRDKVTFDGYRIPQIMVQWVDWDDILQAQEQYPRAQFMNEKLGMSYDSGVRPITKGQLKACCRPEIRLTDIEEFKRIAQGRQIYAGIDWGTGESSSYTVMSLGGYFGTGAFSVFWIHRFTGPDLEPERQIDLISQILTQLQVQIAGTDYGGGFYQNDQLIRRFGPNKIMKYQYNPRQKKKVYWEPNLGRWMCHRSEIMSDVFNALKRQMIALPVWEDFREPFGADILNIFSEYNERLRMDEYKHAPGKADDSFHSILYCLLASMIQNPRPDIITPMKEDGLGNSYNG